MGGDRNRDVCERLRKTGKRQYGFRYRYDPGHLQTDQLGGKQVWASTRR